VEPAITRPEQVTTRAEFGVALTALRATTNLTLRRLAERLDMPVATLGDYFSGRHLPGPSQLTRIRQLLLACGVTGDAEHQLWLEALARARSSSDGRIAHASAARPRNAHAQQALPPPPRSMVTLVTRIGPGQEAVRARVLAVARSAPLEGGGALQDLLATAGHTDPMRTLRPGQWVLVVDEIEEVLDPSG